MSGLEVRPCRTRREMRVFEALPERIWGGDPCFVPPLPGTEGALLRGRHPFRRHGRVTPFLAWRGEAPVGRIAAIVNETHNRHHGDRVGFFGFFDAVDDAEVAGALFEAVRASLAGEGRTTLRGPYSPTSNDACGVLVHGFDDPPAAFMAYNPPYYAALCEASGLRPVRDLLSFRHTRDTPALEWLRPFSERALRSGRVRTRLGDRTRLADEIRTYHGLFNRTLDREWGFMPLTEEDVRDGLRALGRALDPQLVVFLEEDDEPVAMALGVPDLNEHMLRVRGSRGWVRVARFYWNVLTRRPTRARLAVFGGLPQSGRRFLDGALFTHITAQVPGRYREIEFGWIQDVNTRMLNRARSSGLEHVKTHRIYEREI